MPDTFCLTLWLLGEDRTRDCKNDGKQSFRNRDNKQAPHFLGGTGENHKIYSACILFDVKALRFRLVSRLIVRNV
jgi:hypothetical protein